MTYEDLINISDPYKVYIKFKGTYPCDSEIRISTRKNKKYMIYDTDKSKWFHFGSTMTDWTRHGDKQRRIIFLKEISVGLMRIFIALHMLHIIYFGENESDRQIYYFFI